MSSRAAFVARKYHVSFGAVLSTVAADRLLDLIGLVLLALALPLYFPLPANVAEWIVLAAGTAAAGLAVLIVVVRVPRGPELAGALSARAAALVLRPWRGEQGARWAAALGAFVVDFLKSFRTGAQHLANGRRLAVSVLYTAGGWLLVTLYAMCILAAVHVAGEVPLGAGLVLTIMTNLGSAAPSLPGYIGIYHGIATQALEQLMGVSAAPALGYAILAHATWWLTSIAAGFVSLAYEGLSLADVRHLRSEAGEPS